MEDVNCTDNTTIPVNKTIPGYDTVEQFVQAGFKTLVNGTKQSNKIPCGKSRDFYETCPSFHKILRNQADSVLGQLTRVMKHAGCKGNIQRRDAEEKFEMVVDANDTIFERVGTLLDELAGIRKNPDAEFTSKTFRPISGAWNRRVVGEPRSQAGVAQAVTTMLAASKTLEKPQLKFKDKIDNDRSTPFCPQIKFKYNLLKPLAVLFEDDGEIGQYSHPYEFELMKFEPDEKFIKASPPLMYKPLDETPFDFVTTPQQVEEMIAHLRAADVLAVDLEHHNHRTFQGITCLMQISTRDRDFVVDTIALRTDLQPLNEIFTDPKKLKILHGAQFDIQWLQRDIALYIVNMFDTHIAARVLNYPRLSLAFLLQKFCDVQAMKHYQLADWRIRPLHEEMLQYAREDTHYLLYIFDVMRNELLDKANGQDNLVRSVFSESTQLCLTRYVKPIFRADDYLNLYHKSKRLFDNRQLFALQQLYQWRDSTARELDESLGYVLPNHMLLHIAETLPREIQGILACCNPVPPIVRQNLTPIHQLIRKARDQPLVRPVVEATRQVDRVHLNGLAVDSPLRCPHDMTWLPEFRPDLPVLIGKTSDNSILNPALLSETPTISVFENSSKLSRKSVVASMTPYQRYKLVKPYAEALASDCSKAVEDNKEAMDKLEIDRLQNLLKKEKQDKPKKKKAEPVPLSKQVKREKPVKIARETGLEETEKVADIRRNPLADDGIETAEPRVEELPDRPPSEVTPKEKKRKRKKGQDVESFDYSAVDFNKFKSNPVDQLVHKSAKTKTKHKRTNKKFKIAI